MYDIIQTPRLDTSTVIDVSPPAKCADGRPRDQVTETKLVLQQFGEVLAACH